MLFFFESERIYLVRMTINVSPFLHLISFFCWHATNGNAAIVLPYTRTDGASGFPSRFFQLGAERKDSRFLDRETPSTLEIGNDPVKNGTDATKKSVDSTITKVSHVNPAQMVKDDMHRVVANFMPGRRPDPTFYILPMCGVLLAISWFSFFALKIYQPDREEKLERWAHRPRSPRDEDPRAIHAKPDLVLMFHHPLHEGYTDRDNIIHQESLHACLTKGPREYAFLPRTVALGEVEGETMGATFTRGLEHLRSSMAMGSFATTSGSPDEEDEAAEDDDEDNDETCVIAAEQSQPTKRTLHSVRCALLQDLYRSLPDHGFEVFCWSSVDDDELYVGVSLSDQDIIRDQLLLSNTKLQVRHEVVKHLGIAQDPEEHESSPPYLKYDARMAKNVLGSHWAGREVSDLDFYHSFHGKRTEGSIISGADRVRLLFRLISSHVNLDMAVEVGILKDWYPAHSAHWVQNLHACWASWDLLLDVSVVQPINYIKSYMGSRVAFTFAWNGLYCKMLFAILPVALLFEVANSVNVFLGTNFFVKGAVTSFSVCVVLWSKVASNLWEREQGYFINLWNLADTPDFSVRPDFQGDKMVSPVDRNHEEKQYPPHLYFLRQAGTWAVTLLFCAFVASVIFIWTSVFDGRMDLVASICLAAMIQVFQFIFNKMAESLTKAENHKYQYDYYNSYLRKLFIFQFVNQYSAFFYIAVKQQYTEDGCPKDDCIQLLKMQLSMTLLLCTAVSLSQVVLASGKVWLTLYLEDREMRKGLKEGEEIPTRSYLEEQSKYEEFRIRAQIEGMMQLVVALGYVLIFGAVAPRIVPLCLCVFLVQLRATAYQSTTTFRRPLPRISAGLGAWVGIVRMLNMFGLLFSGFLLVAYGPSFKGTFLLTKVSGFVVYVVLMSIAWIIVSIFCPPSDPCTKLLVQRRNYVQDKIMQKTESENIKQIKERERELKRQQTSNGELPFHAVADFRVFKGDEIEAGEWDAIPRLIH